ncbi:hypothetical protein BDR04DRAFT_432221 [Suillus decipiens]|nr:hypothetical protein BDR04DRAFT_432221 [Suillus decipiens]
MVLAYLQLIRAWGIFEPRATSQANSGHSFTNFERFPTNKVCSTLGLTSCAMFSLIRWSLSASSRWQITKLSCLNKECIVSCPKLLLEHTVRKNPTFDFYWCGPPGIRCLACVYAR